MVSKADWPKIQAEAAILIANSFSAIINQLRQQNVPQTQRKNLWRWFLNSKHVFHKYKEKINIAKS